MTQEDKLILLKDLSARLPYYPKCEMIDEVRVVNYKKDPSYTSTLFPKHIELFSYHNNFTIKPYLRPMSSMTEEEKNIFYSFMEKDNYGFPTDVINKEKIHEYLNWLLANHFDFNGLIPKGLAIAITEKNNPYKE